MLFDKLACFYFFFLKKIRWEKLSIFFSQATQKMWSRIKIKQNSESEEVKQILAGRIPITDYMTSDHVLEDGKETDSLIELCGLRQYIQY